VNLSSGYDPVKVPLKDQSTDTETSAANFLLASDWLFQQILRFTVFGDGTYWKLAIQLCGGEGRLLLLLKRES
jgi:hypothetical protein